MATPSAPSGPAQAGSTQPDGVQPSTSELLTLASSTVQAVQLSDDFFYHLTEAHPLEYSSMYTQQYSRDFFKRYGNSVSESTVSGHATALFTRLADLDVVERPQEGEFYFDPFPLGDSTYIDQELWDEMRGGRSPRQYMEELIPSIKSTHGQLLEDLVNVAKGIQDAAEENAETWPTTDIKETASAALRRTRELLASVATFRVAGEVIEVWPGYISAKLNTGPSSVADR